MAKTKNIDEMSYEEAFHELETVVTALEGESLPLDKSMEMYERGQALAKRCAKLLEEAELRVKQLAGENEVDFEAEE